MRILDIDLDFFLSRISYGGARDGRLDSGNYLPWPAQNVRTFLETRCGLSKANRLPGKVVLTHDQVFYDWRNRIESGQLLPPFEVVHVDAHADLGMGDGGYQYLMTELLGKPASMRSYPRSDEGSGIGEGNYLAFAIACRWISKLTYVHHPECGDDLLTCHMKNYDDNSGFVQLKYYGDTPISEDRSPLALEPEVPFEKISCELFQNSGPSDWVYLAQSPSYTPESADTLIPVIREYMQAYEEG